ncbi:MAG: DUF721 domain-containing protein [Actinomycetota bacterium]
MARKSGGEPRALGDLVRSLVEGRGWNERMSFGRLRDEWATVVGSEVAARCEPVSLVGGTLSIRADGPAWASELTLLSRSIAERADSYLGGGVVKDVRVSAGPPRSTA